ncbi:energy transducer TonB [Thiorhodovibrio winogradskyi]|nr:energy transducer TonB [Thiorhodovibrio winogradskyi]
MLRTLGALLLALAVILTLVWLMQTLISARGNNRDQEPPAPSVVYLIEAATTKAQEQPMVEAPAPPRTEPEPPAPPEPPQPEPLPERLELPLDPRPLDLPAVEQPPKPKPKAKPQQRSEPRAQPAARQPSVSQPRVASQLTANAKAAAPKPSAPAKFDRRATFAPRPRYPANAKRRRIEGSVTVKFTVTRAGRVRNPQVVAAQPPGVFERAALAAIERWRFKPQPADFPGVTQNIRFSLRNDG